MKTANLLLVAFAGLLASCTSISLRPTRYIEYPNIPDRPVSGMIRNTIKAQPWIDRRAFYGNYGGFGDNGGKPVDDLDEVFRRHDIVYNEVHSFRAFRWADEAVALAIARVDPARLSPKGQDFRQRSHHFFVTHCWRWIGKPISSYFLWHEAPDCPFQTCEQIHTFFSLPNPDDASRFATRPPQQVGPPTFSHR